MAKLTVSEIKKQIAALEARAARLVAEETRASVGKVRALMNQLGVTLEHLSSSVGRKGAAVKKTMVRSKPKTAQRAGKGVAKYRDPQTGATWTGFGRAPGWIAGATDRDAFLVSKPRERTPGAVVGAPVVKKRATAKKAATKAAPVKKATKTAVKRAAPKKVPPKTAAPATPKSKPSIKAAAATRAAKRAVSAGSGETAAAAVSSQASAT